MVKLAKQAIKNGGGGLPKKGNHSHELLQWLISNGDENQYFFLLRISESSSKKSRAFPSSFLFVEGISKIHLSSFAFGPDSTIGIHLRHSRKLFGR